MSDVEYSVVPDAMEAQAQRLERAAHAVHELREHPGVVRGRAHDCGDGELADALVGFAQAWSQGLADLAAQATRWQVLLRTAAELYQTTEQSAARSGPASWVSR